MRDQRCSHLSELVVIDVAVANVHASGAAREVQGGKGHEIVGSTGLLVAVSGLACSALISLAHNFAMFL